MDPEKFCALTTPAGNSLISFAIVPSRLRWFFNDIFPYFDRYGGLFDHVFIDYHHVPKHGFIGYWGLVVFRF